MSTSPNPLLTLTDPADREKIMQLLPTMAALLGLPSPELLPVRDGLVARSTLVWWRGEYGPEQEKADLHWNNIKDHPDCYQLRRPEILYADQIQPPLPRVTRFDRARVWCETCNGTGHVTQEIQLGVTGSGTSVVCPDCEGRGYNWQEFRVLVEGDAS